MTIQRIHGRKDWWQCHYKHNGRTYNTFANSLDNVIMAMFMELERNGIYLLAKIIHL